MNKIYIISFIFSLIAGYVDTVGFIALNGIFTAHVTGNLVSVGASFNKIGNENHLIQLILIPIFFISVFFTSLYFKISKIESFSKLRIALILQAFLLSIIFFLERNVSFLVIGCLGVIAMGIQNTYMKIILNKILPTTVMTGNVTLLAIEASNRFLGKNENNIKGVISTILGFLMGAIIGAVMVYFFGIKAFTISSLFIILLILGIKNSAWKDVIA